jgi:ribonuclease D
MLTPLLSPRHGTPEIVATESEYEKVISALLKGEGPIAIDAERASGYRYSQRAYLIQIFRKGGGLHLIDPIPLKDSKLWQRFNDELAESLLELQLAKEHSAVDWSIRPLRPEWIAYAALDVDILLDIRDKVEQLLSEQKKLKWAEQDFASIIKNYQDYEFTDSPKSDRWRRTSGMHKVRDRLSMTIIRDLWLSRDELARELDLAPGRVLGDEAIVELAIKRPDNLEEVAKVIGWRTRLEAPPFGRWLKVLTTSLKTPITEQVELRVASQSMPPIKIWKEKNPLGYARLTHARAALIELSKQLQIPTENLVTPDYVKRICWQDPPTNVSEYESFVEGELTRLGARSWQVEQVVSVIAPHLSATEALAVPESAEVENEASVVP